MGVWNPWRGCHRYSTGCKYCYIHKGDYKKGIDTNIVTKTEKFYAPIEKTKNGAYKMKAGQMVYVCFLSDFLLEDAGLKDFGIVFRTIGKTGTKMLRLAARLKIRKTQIIDWVFFPDFPSNTKISFASR